MAIFSVLLLLLPNLFVAEADSQASQFRGPPKKCKSNESFSCGSVCTCEDAKRNGPESCRLVCANSATCFCRESFVRTSSGECIPIDQCLSKRPPMSCKSGERLDACPPPLSCQRTCSNQDPPQCLPIACFPGCVCVDGLVRDDASGRCIPSHQCKLEPNCSLKCGNCFRCKFDTRGEQFCAFDPDFRCPCNLRCQHHCDRCFNNGVSEMCVPIPGCPRG